MSGELTVEGAFDVINERKAAKADPGLVFNGDEYAVMLAGIGVDPDELVAFVGSTVETVLGWIAAYETPIETVICTVMADAFAAGCIYTTGGTFT